MDKTKLESRMDAAGVPEADPGRGSVTPQPGHTSAEAAAPSAEGETSSGGSAPEGFAGAIAGHIAAVAERIVRAISPEPLANLYEVHPEARESSPRELGFRFVPVEEILGTAVAGIDQRGQDFLPLPRFKGENWQARWQRIRAAIARLQPLPPVDLIKYAGGYWVLDGHNRVAAALADRAVGVDAMVTELVALDGHSSEPATALLPHLGEVAELRAAASGRRPALGVRATEQSLPSEEGAPGAPETRPDAIDISRHRGPAGWGRGGTAA